MKPLYGAAVPSAKCRGVVNTGARLAPVSQCPDLKPKNPFQLPAPTKYFLLHILTVSRGVHAESATEIDSNIDI